MEFYVLFLVQLPIRVSRYWEIADKQINEVYHQKEPPEILLRKE